MNIQVIAFLLLLMVASCREEKEDLNLTRTFRPAAFSITSGETEAIIEWQPSLFTKEGSVSYFLEVSSDPVFTNKIYSLDTTSTSVTLAYPLLEIRKPYYARVRAIASNPALNSEWSVSEAFGITGDQFLYLAPDDAEVLDNAVILRWLDKPGLTKITISPENNTSFDIELTEADHDTLMLVLRDLAPVTNYVAEIFAGDESKGIVTFRTKASIEGNLVDLRGITGNPNILVDTLPDIAPGSVVVLKRGEIYEVASYSFDKSVKLISGLDFIPQFARIVITSNFNILAGSSIDSLIFQDIILTGADFNGDYIFNFNQPGTIGKIGYENCRVHKFRGMNRAQTASPGTIISNLSVNNCVIDSVREYGIATASSASSIANIKITNSTVYKLRKFVDHRVAGANSLVIENCTLNEMPGTGGGGATYIIDYNTFDVATPIIIKNSIFGTTWSETGGMQTVNGYRIGGGSVLSITSSYKTSDFVVATGNFTELSGYSGASTALWTDPANGNFSFKDNSFTARSSVGDPRWRP